MRYKCLVLDHDDTAVSSSKQLHYPAYIEIIGKMRPGARIISFEEFMLRSFDPGYLEYLRSELDFLEEELKTEFDMWRMIVKDRTPDFFPGFTDLVRDYQRSGGIIAVVSHSSEDVILRNYASCGLVPDAVCGYSWRAEENKPNPAPVLKIMEKFRLSKEDVLVVDDLALGRTMAERAGVDFACAGWSHYGIGPIISAMKKGGGLYFSTVGEFRDYVFPDAPENEILKEKDRQKGDTDGNK